MKVIKNQQCSIIHTIARAHVCVCVCVCVCMCARVCMVSKTLEETRVRRIKSHSLQESLEFLSIFLLSPS